MRRFVLLTLLAAACEPPSESLLEGRRVVVARDSGVSDGGGGTGRSDAGSRDAGIFVIDAGLNLEDGGAIDLDAGLQVEGADGGQCSNECTCIIRFDHSGGGAFISSIELPCCATLCLGGSRGAWTCEESGQLTTHPATLVCPP